MKPSILMLPHPSLTLPSPSSCLHVPATRLNSQDISSHHTCHPVPAQHTLPLSLPLPNPATIPYQPLSLCLCQLINLCLPCHTYPSASPPPPPAREGGRLSLSASGFTAGCFLHIEDCLSRIAQCTPHSASTCDIQTPLGSAAALLTFFLCIHALSH